MTIPRIALALAFGLVALSAARAQTAQGVPGEINNFVTQYVSATNAKDSARLRSFLYPKSLACITPENKDYYDEMASHIGEPIPPNYKFSVMPHCNIRIEEACKPVCAPKHRLGSRSGSNSIDHPARVRRRIANTRSCRQFVEQRLSIFQIECVEAFSEPAVDRSQ